MARLSWPSIYGIGAKVSLLATVLVAMTAWFLATQLGSKAGEEIVNHEILDLRDETNLAAEETLNDVKQLRMDMWRLSRLSDDVHIVDTDHPRYLQVEYANGQAGDLRAAYKQDWVASIAWDTPRSDFLQDVRSQPGRVVLSEIVTAKVKRADRQAQDEMLVIMAGILGSGTSATLPAARNAGSAEPRLMVITMKLHRLTLNALSPQRLAFVINHRREMVYHRARPGAAPESDRPPIVDQEHEPTLFEGISQLDELFAAPLGDLESAHRRRLGKTLPIDETNLKAYAFYFNATEPIVNAKASQLEDALAGLGPDFRVIYGDPPVIRVRSSSVEQGREFQREIVQRLKAAGPENGDALEVSWLQSEPVRCETFMVHFNRLHYDVDPLAAPSDEAPSIDDPKRGRYVDIAVASAKEEIQLDVFASMRPVYFGAVLLAVIAAICAVLLSGLITRPLKKIIASTEQFAHGQSNVSLPVRVRGEVGDLARAFDHMIGQIQDRSRELLDREARLRAVVNLAVDGIFTCDENRCVRSFNRAAERLFGCSEAEAIGKPFSAFIKVAGPLEDGSAEATWTVSELMGGTNEGTGLRADGSTFPLEVSVSAVPLADGMLFTSIVRDVTLRKAAEGKIRELNEHLKRNADELEQRVRERTSELSEARDEALEANRAKSRFLAQMSHELRTPLNAIIGYSESLLEESEQADAPLQDYQSDLRRVIDAGWHLKALIDDLLDLAKIEAGRLELSIEDAEVRPLVEGVVTTVQKLADKNANRLELICPDDAGSLETDPMRVRQILLNLLGNACKFTHEGTITLRVTPEARHETNGVTFSVEDTGIGITPEQMKNLFEEFSQAEGSTSRKYGGTGLGLAICKRLCELMQGEISAKSEFGAGSQFSFWLPRGKEVPLSSHRAPDVTAAPASIRHVPSAGNAERVVLVVDDDPAARELMQRYLSRGGFSVVTCAHGSECLALAHEYNPVLITLDVKMPDQDGWAVLSELKADPELCDIPVMMATVVEDEGLGLALGASDYLTKPIDRSRLMSILQKYQPRSSGTRRVLVVEDHLSTRELLARMLTNAGWSVEQAENGRAAVSALHRQPPDLILLDLIMPEMDGFDFLQELRRHQEWQTIPVVVVTAKELSAAERTQLDGTVQQVLRKGSYAKDELLHAVRELIVINRGPEEELKGASNGKDSAGG